MLNGKKWPMETIEKDELETLRAEAACWRTFIQQRLAGQQISESARFEIEIQLDMITSSNAPTATLHVSRGSLIDPVTGVVEVSSPPFALNVGDTIAWTFDVFNISHYRNNPF
jgi:hypothetical protein